MAAAFNTARHDSPEKPPAEQGNEAQGAMGFLDHLEELRKRLIRICLGIGVGMVLAWTFIGRLVSLVLAPAIAMLPPGAHIISSQPGEGFSFYMTVALIAGFIFSLPYVAYQVWLFIAP